MKQDAIQLYRYEKKHYHVDFYRNYCDISEDKKRMTIEYSFHKSNGFVFDHSEVGDEKSFVENFANPLCHVFRKKSLIVVEKIDEKISIKLFHSTKIRQQGRVYFTENKNLYFITYNTKTHDLYDGQILNYHLKRNFRKKLRRNQFWRQPIQNLCENIRGSFYPHNSTESQEEFLKEIEKIIEIFLQNIPNVEKNFLYGPDDTLFKTRANGIGIKLPDNWQVFSKLYPTPTKKLLKKHDFKFIDALQGYYGLTGGKFKKIFHNLERIDTRTLAFVVDYFGPDFIKHQKLDILKTIFDPYEQVNNAYFNQLLNTAKLTDKEKNNFWNMLVSVLKGDYNFGTIMDHIDFICKLRNFGEDVKFKARNLDEFRIEHHEFSTLLDSYKKGLHYRFYNDEFINRVQQPIFDREYFYPVLLTSTEEYNEESSHQSNCVRGYVDKSSSIIISLRKGDKTSKERATIEYRIAKRSNKIILENVQCLGRFNNKLPEDWSKVVSSLDERMKILGNSNVFTLPEMITKFKTKELYQKAVFTDKGYLNWDIGTNSDNSNDTIIDPLNHIELW